MVAPDQQWQKNQQKNNLSHVQIIAHLRTNRPEMCVDGGQWVVDGSEKTKERNQGAKRGSANNTNSFALSYSDFFQFDKSN